MLSLILRLARLILLNVSHFSLKIIYFLLLLSHLFLKALNFFPGILLLLGVLSSV